jgi:CRISPR system Cascade subunit CasC
MTTHIDIYAVQSFASHNLNRDDTGAPKSQTFGGIRRSRISSQCLKSAVRKDFVQKAASGTIPDLTATRTKRVPAMVAARIVALDPSITVKDAGDAVLKAFTGLKTQAAKKRAADKVAADPNAEVLEGLQTLAALFTVSDKQVDALARLVIDEIIAKKGAPDKALPGMVRDVLASEMSAEQALFGRFFADSSDLTIAAAAQVAHALGTGAMPEDLDYFTGRDDLGAVSGEEDNDSGSGAAMLGHKAFTSGPMYRYASVSLDQLAELLEDSGRAVTTAVEFVDSFIKALPSGSQTSYAANNLPTTVVVAVREDQPVNLAGAFETPVETAEAATKALVGYANTLHEVYGNDPVAMYHFSLAPDAANELRSSVPVKSTELSDLLSKTLAGRV